MYNSSKSDSVFGEFLMKITVAMDSFKGSLTSFEAGNAVKCGILKVCPDAEVTVVPLADGGEGTIDALMPFIHGTPKTITVTGPLGGAVKADYVFEPFEKCAYIEMAKASGLTLIKPEEQDPYRASTYGTGELIRDAIQNGAEKLVICIGGSATNDGGAGMLRALGARLADRNGNEILPGAIGLKDLASADLSDMMGRDLEITVACDVTNPLCGPDGASHVYGPQKGATYEQAANMDLWLKHYAQILGSDPYEQGTGAAGGMSFALKNVLSAIIRPGADIVTEITGAEDLIRNCDMVITGEGRMDSQTVNGKAPYRIMKLGAKYGKPVYGITGILGDGYEACLKAGFDRIMPLSNPTMVTAEAIKSVTETARALIEEIR